MVSIFFLNYSFTKYFLFFKNIYSFYLQLKRIAMGTSCEPDVVNLYLPYFEIKSS